MMSAPTRLDFGVLRPTPIQELELPSRIEDLLLAHSIPIDTVEKLLGYTERQLLIHVYHIGKGSILVINLALQEHGYPTLRAR